MTTKAILLVEDTPDDAELTMMSLKRSGLLNEVVLAEDGLEALDYLFCEGRYAGRIHDAPALILLDIKMPRLDGIEVLQRLRADDRTKLLPVVMLTTSTEDTDLARAYEAGANAYVRKPVSLADSRRRYGNWAYFGYSRTSRPKSQAKCDDVLTPLRTLVIEDCEDDHDLLLLKLRQAGFEPNALRVETIAEIEAALALNEWQMVFSDFDLPGFDGLRALKLVRGVDLEIPFFIVSGVIDEEQAVAAMKAGAQDYFFKGKLARLGPAVGRELHEAEQRRQRREAKVELERDRNVLRSDRIRFVDVMSHEMRTPLNIINVAAGMLERYGERMGLSGRQERITEIQDAVARMTRVIDKVLLTSRLELRRWDLKSETFDPAVWCEEFLRRDFGYSDPQNRIQIHHVDLPAKVAMDPRVVEIALQNLLSNALKYSAPDFPVGLELREAASGRFEFCVRDRGIGIPEADMPHIFTSFYRASNVGDVPGTGLGLAIVKACADVHGGTVEMESNPGGGTCIRMYFPDWLRIPNALGEVALSTAEVIQV